MPDGHIARRGRLVGEGIVHSGWVRIIAAPPDVPRVLSVTDGVDLLAGRRIVSRSVKLVIEEVTSPEQLTVAVDGVPVRDLDVFCTDPFNLRHEMNFTLPEAIGSGPHSLKLEFGRSDSILIPSRWSDCGCCLRWFCCLHLRCSCSTVRAIFRRLPQTKALFAQRFRKELEPSGSRRGDRDLQGTGDPGRCARPGDRG